MKHHRRYRGFALVGVLFQSQRQQAVHRATCPLGCLKFLIHFNALSSVPALNGFLIRHGEKCSIDRTQANSSFLVLL